jgi:hypothetical protein
MNTFMIQHLFISLIALLISGSWASAAGEREILKNLQGCFRVTYEFIDDGNNFLEGKENNSRFEFWQGQPFYEWISLREEGPILRFQHFGIAGTHVMKHWREDWNENPDHSWTQKVYNPSGTELRYECTAPFEFNQWNCHAGKAARPVIRDTHRTDYAYLDRENTLQITTRGWVQSEKNRKMTQDHVQVSNEIGWNRYQRVNDINLCKGAIQLAGD